MIKKEPDSIPIEVWRDIRNYLNINELLAWSISTKFFQRVVKEDNYLEKIFEKELRKSYWIVTSDTSAQPQLIRFAHVVFKIFIEFNLARSILDARMLEKYYSKRISLLKKTAEWFLKAIPKQSKDNLDFSNAHAHYMSIKMKLKKEAKSASEQGHPSSTLLLLNKLIYKKEKEFNVDQGLSENFTAARLFNAESYYDPKELKTFLEKIFTQLKKELPQDENLLEASNQFLIRAIGHNYNDAIYCIDKLPFPDLKNLVKTIDTWLKEQQIEDETGIKDSFTVFALARISLEVHSKNNLELDDKFVLPDSKEERDQLFSSSSESFKQHRNQQLMKWNLSKKLNKTETEKDCSSSCCTIS